MEAKVRAIIKDHVPELDETDLEGLVYQLCKLLSEELKQAIGEFEEKALQEVK